MLLFPGYLKRLTVAYYLQALVTHEMPQDSAVAISHAGLSTKFLDGDQPDGPRGDCRRTLWLAGRAVEGDAGTVKGSIKGRNEQRRTWLRIGS